MHKSSGDKCVLIVVPRRSIATESIVDLRQHSKTLGLWSEVVSSHDVLKPVNRKCIRVVPAHDLLQALGGNNHNSIFDRLELVVLENLELLDAEYELTISVLRQQSQGRSIRYVGLSSSLNDPVDLAAWLQVDPFALHSFRPSDRDQSLSITTKTFTIPSSSALFKAMAKPAHAAIQTNPGEPAMIFVPSRGHCRTVAIDLLTQSALEQETEMGYIPPDISDEELQLRLIRLQDRSLVDFVSRGVGFYHEGVHKIDRTIILEMYVEGIIRVLIVPRTSCWTVPVRAGVVVVLGTQYVQASDVESDRQIRDYELEEIVRMQGRAIRPNQKGNFYLFCPAEAKDTFTRFLNDGLPLESSLHEADLLLQNWFKREAAGNKGYINKQEVVQTLSFTFFAHRSVSNPVYYDTLPDKGQKELFSRMADGLGEPNTTE
jgi:antiviral helicase SLH1